MDTSALCRILRVCRAAIVVPLMSALPLAAVPDVLAAQVMYENQGNPGRDFDTDKLECIQSAQRWAAVSAAMQPRPVTGGGMLGQIVNGLSEAQGQERVNNMFLTAFRECLGKRGWTPVTQRELDQRATASAMAETARQQAAERAAMEDLRAERPEVSEKYDEFERARILTATPAYVPTDDGTSVMRVGLIAVTGTDPKKRPGAMLTFTAVSHGGTIGTDPRVILLSPQVAEPLRYEGDEVKYEREALSENVVLERVWIFMHVDDFRLTMTGAELRARVGARTMTMPPGHMSAFKILAERMPPPPASDGASPETPSAGASPSAGRGPAGGRARTSTGTRQKP